MIIFLNDDGCRKWFVVLDFWSKVFEYLYIEVIYVIIIYLILLIK